MPRAETAAAELVTKAARPRQHMHIANDVHPAEVTLVSEACRLADRVSIEASDSAHGAWCMARVADSMQVSLS